MKKEGVKYTILIEGQAGQGPNVLSKIIGSTLTKSGYFVFVSREYGSFVRGGRNQNILTFSDKPLNSNPSKVDIQIVLEESMKPAQTKGKKPLLIKCSGEDNMFFAGKVAKLFGLDFLILEKELKSLKRFEQNFKNAKKGYETAKTKFPLPKLQNKITFTNGAQGVSEGAIKSGIDIYYAYPMTPSTTLLNELADRQLENKYFVMELESEIGVINTAIGSAITGAKTMIGTSGGGFDLMTESLSLTGIAEVPLVIYLAQRPGPATGAATYTAQGDLNIALYAGHGEFSRLVIAPGDTLECQELTSQSFYFSQKYKIPAIILSDKHLAESLYSNQLSEIPNLIKSEKSVQFKKYNSYEHNEFGTAADDSETVNKNVEKKLKKAEEIKKDAENFKPIKIYGNPDSKTCLLFWGSTKGAVLDAIRDLNLKAIQILYLNPLSSKLQSELENSRKIFVVENNSTSQLSQLISQKTGIQIPEKNKILRYDGRPFLSDELNNEIKKRMK